jgi:hypothetical protein
MRTGHLVRRIGVPGALAAWSTPALLLSLALLLTLPASASAPLPVISSGVRVLPVAQATTAAAARQAIHVSPTAGPVGATINVSGTGYPPGAPLVLRWSTVNASWVVAGNPPQVTGTAVVNIMKTLGSAQPDSSGSFSVRLTVPTDYGTRNHAIQAFMSNGSAFPPKALFDVEPSFRISPSSGPAGTPIAVTATGLGYSLYATSYHVSWDNSYVGYATALTSEGSTNFTIYASGAPGVHYIDIYQGYPGPGYLNPQQGPPSGETQSNFPPLIPFHAQFTIASPQTQSGLSGWAPAVVFAFALVVAVLTAVQLGLVMKGARGKATAKGIAALLLIVALVVGGAGLFMLNGPGQAAQTAAYTPRATVVRPSISVQQNTAASGPRISVTPDIASVGSRVTVTGAGFAPDALLPITWSTRQGSNILGYSLVNLPLRNVTAGADGGFSFTMNVPSDLGGRHYVSAENLTRNSNGTLFLQRSASISSDQGPAGTQITITLLGVGWNYNTNIVAIDYDNSYIGYACGFNSQGNVTVTVTASGQPGLHSIDIYPSIWWGTSTPAAQLTAEYRYPLLTSQDHPALMPSFHFSFLVTGS